ncbi:peptidoglycan-binding domain-containing protein [Streptomyces sp. sk2.1]|uniref:peptidoglycan-binding domain-containing protein n=1 Tax=Streptomyces sp. sk2.1 TaxID=2478959 RepID=UPI0011E7EA54|nr:peptidoglycan-binding domain-containing protein [Streptomyces sp. sk2.1]TXS80553.1 peptidoglycan-binding protein [Streptomyces sp. sk2.1]
MSRTVKTAAPADSTPARARKNRRSVVVPLLLVAVLGGAGALAVTRPWERGESTTGQAPVAHDVVAVGKGSLSTGIQAGGTLGFDKPTPVVATGGGTLTALPAVDTVVRTGGRLYEVDGRPVVLLKGARPMWRDLGPKATDGPDVEQLKRNLIKLGHAEGLGLEADQKFTPGTATAVKRWQKALGVPQTGTVTLGSVVMLPQGTVRVQQVGAQLGAAVGTASVLTVTSTDLVVTVQPAENQLSRFKPNGKVTVKLADGGTVNGRIRSLLRGGTDDGEGGSGDGGSGKTTVTVALDAQGPAKKSGPSSVVVSVVGDSVSDALIVPVTALLALDGGGYGVKVAGGADATAARLVTVRLGLVADAKAQISGDIRAGDQVVVPK